MDKFPRYVALTVGVGFVGFGLWAFVSPRSFYDTAATFGEYHEHFIHDLGAFQIAVGAMLFLAATMRDALYAALAGATIGHGVHIASHLLDADQGRNQEATIPFLLVIGGFLLAATILRSRQIRG